MNPTSAEAFRRQHNERMLQLGVMPDKLLPMPNPYQIRPPAFCDIRVLQWNILADGLADDGFVVRNVLQGEEEGFDLLLSSLQEAGKVEEEVRREAAFQAVKERFCTDDSKQNLGVLIDWDRRWLKMRELIARYDPDVITLQEVDHMQQAHQDLGEMGYECKLVNDQEAGREKDRPYHPTPYERRDWVRYVRGLHEKGFAFAPKTPSHAMRLAKLRKLPHPGDDGCAVFWRQDAFEALSIDFVGLDDGMRNSGSVRVELKRKKDGTRFYVICAHLRSGSKPEDERKRLAQIKEYTLTPLGTKTGPSLLDWFRNSAEARPTIFCVDANSAPNRNEEETLWRAMHAVSVNENSKAQSVWDDAFEPGGAPKGEGVVATSNKMRGPLSDQNKVGEHSLSVVDHIYYSQQLRFRGHVFHPFKYGSEQEATSELLPTVEMPSDHSPVIVDLELPSITLGAS